MVGRGGGRGGGANSRYIADALGIARHEMGAFMRQRTTEPPPMYPPLQRSLIPLVPSLDLTCMVEVKAELHERFAESSFNLDIDSAPVDIKRYTDKYKKVERDPFNPDLSRIPDELIEQPKKKKDANGASKEKKRKVSKEEAQQLGGMLDRLERNEGDAPEEEEEGSDEEESEKSEGEKEAVPASEDEQEEDNDYVFSYFDNGEGGGSDDGLGDDDY